MKGAENKIVGYTAAIKDLIKIRDLNYNNQFPPFSKFNYYRRIRQIFPYPNVQAELQKSSYFRRKRHFKFAPEV